MRLHSVEALGIERLGDRVECLEQEMRLQLRLKKLHPRLRQTVLKRAARSCSSAVTAIFATTMICQRFNSSLP